DQDPPSYLGLYRRSRGEQAGAIAKVAIAVERISDLILVAGGDNQVWPSVHQAECIRARRNEHGVDATVLTVAEAGHGTVLPGEPIARGGALMARGGTEVADRRLGDLAWSQLRPRLRVSA
ncbi:MAG: acyl-CoA thioester hydrolase/BAAT C-terminal domain-containing protein, partial [Actinomycetota bacterium]